MEITNETHQKLLGQYIDQKVKLEGGQTVRLSGIYTGRDHITIAEFISRKNNKCKDDLILKPLSKISKNNALEVADIIMIPIIHEGTSTPASDSWRVEKVIEFLTDRYIKEYVRLEFVIQAQQALQQLGYDLPQYLLDSKTLKEAGLAIYE